MAEEEKKDQEEGQEGEQPKSKKGLIIIIIVAIIAIGASVGVTLFLLGGDESAEEEVAEEEVAEVKQPAIYMDLQPAFLVTYSDGGRHRYMQVHVSVSSRDAAAIGAVEHHLPYIKSKINSLYSSQDFKSVQTDEGKQFLRTESLRVINEVLEGEGESLIENVFFTNFVLQ